MKRKVLPLILTIVVFVLDQLTKQLVVLNIPAYTIGASFFGDFLRIIHVYNPGIAFSMGNSLPDAARGMLFAVAPLVVLVVVLVKSLCTMVFHRDCLPQRVGLVEMLAVLQLLFTKIMIMMMCGYRNYA